MRKFALVVVIVLSLCGSASLEAQEYPTRVQIKSILVNRDVVQMVHAKVSESTILQAITASPTNFNITGAGITALKTAGVPETIIKAMISASFDPKARVEVITPAQAPTPRNSLAPRTDPAPSQPPAQPTYIPEEIGVYVFANGVWIPIEPEVVNWKTGGVLKQLATLGLDKQHIDGTVRKPHSSFDLTSADVSGKLDIDIRSADRDSASDYKLLRFGQKSDRRSLLR